jgi:hypothetical protein
MENSTSLRFLEASGRPSGTGRPSLPPPRADQDRAGGGRTPAHAADERADDARELRRKTRLHDAARSAAEAAQVKGQKPFGTLLGDAQETPPSNGDPSAEPNTAEQAALASGTQAPAKSASGDAQTKRAAGEKSAEAPQAQQAGEPQWPAALLAASAQPADAHSPRLRPDALPLPSATAVAPAAAATQTEDAAAVEDVAAATEPAAAQASDAPFAAAPDPAQLSARDGSLVAQSTLAPGSRLEPAPPTEAKAPPAPPPPPADTGRAGEILRQMRVHFSPELRTATIQLSPPELGRISIRMRVDAGELHAVIRAEKRETLDALQRHVPELKATLEQLGIQARHFDLQLGFEQQGARRDPQQPRAGGNAAGHEHDPHVREHERRLLRTLSTHAGGIDTYA